MGLGFTSGVEEGCGLGLSWRSSPSTGARGAWCYASACAGRVRALLAEVVEQEAGSPSLPSACAFLFLHLRARAYVYGAMMSHVFVRVCASQGSGGQGGDLYSPAMTSASRSSCALPSV
eukprot:1656793-Rhodomonas_salina.4